MSALLADRDPRAGLRPGTVITYRVGGKLFTGKTVGQPDIDGGRRPGLGRIVYHVLPGLKRRDGSVSFGTYAYRRVRATEVVEVLLDEGS